MLLFAWIRGHAFLILNHGFSSYCVCRMSYFVFREGYLGEENAKIKMQKYSVKIKMRFFTSFRMTEGGSALKAHKQRIADNG